MSQDTPAKQYRFEKHLSRQRGAGVRNLATDFGFTFNLGQAPPESPKPRQETDVERRKTKDLLDTSNELPLPLLAHQSPLADHTSKAHKSPARARGSKAKVPRRLKIVGDEEVAPTEKSAAHSDSHVILEGCSKGRGRTKKTKDASESKRSQPVEVVEQQPNRRPKRRAATTAIDKMAAGFEEEALPIDKRRRDSVHEQSLRRRRKKAVDEAFKDSGEITHEPILSTSPKRKAGPEQSLNSHGELGEHGSFDGEARIMEKRDIAAGKLVRPRPGERKRKRIPLKEVQANTRSVSPEKPAVSEKEKSRTNSEAQSTKIEVTGPKDVILEAPQAPAGRASKRKAAKIFNDSSHASTGGGGQKSKDKAMKDQRDTTKSQHDLSDPTSTKPNERSIRGRDCCQSPSAIMKNSKRNRPETIVAADADGIDHQIAEVATDESTEKAVKPHRRRKRDESDGPSKGDMRVTRVKVDNTCNQASTEETAKPIDASKGTFKASSKTSRRRDQVEAAVEHEGQEDVDWLFDKKEAKSLRTVASRVRAARPSTRKRPSRTSDIDLDDLLSNIASFVPPSQRR